MGSRFPESRVLTFGCFFQPKALSIFSRAACLFPARRAHSIISSFVLTNLLAMRVVPAIRFRVGIRAKKISKRAGDKSGGNVKVVFGFDIVDSSSRFLLPRAVDFLAFTRKPLRGMNVLFHWKRGGKK